MNLPDYVTLEEQDYLDEWEAYEEQDDPDNGDDLPFTDETKDRVSALSEEEADAAFRRRVSAYAPLDEPGTQYLILHRIPLRTVTDDDELLEDFGANADACFRAGLYRNGRPVMLYGLAMWEGGRLVWDNPWLLQHGLPVLPADIARWPSLRQAVAEAAKRERGPDGARAGKAEKKPSRTALCRVSQDGWPELAAKGLLKRPDSPVLTGYGREFGLMPVSGPYCPDAPKGEKWPRSVCLPPKWESCFIFPLDYRKDAEEFRMVPEEEDDGDRDLPIPTPARLKEPRENRLSLSDRLFQQKTYGGTSPREFLRSVDRLMEMPFWKLSVLHAGAIPAGITIGLLSKKEGARQQDARVRSFGGYSDGPELTCLEAFKKLDAMLDARPFDPGRGTAQTAQTAQTKQQSLDEIFEEADLPFTTVEKGEPAPLPGEPNPWQLLSDIAYKYCTISRYKKKGGNDES